MVSLYQKRCAKARFQTILQLAKSHMRPSKAKNRVGVWSVLLMAMAGYLRSASACSSATLQLRDSSNSVSKTYRYRGIETNFSKIFQPSEEGCTVGISCSATGLPALCGEAGFVTQTDSQVASQPAYTPQIGINWGNACSSKSVEDCGPVNCPTKENCRWSLGDNRCKCNVPTGVSSDPYGAKVRVVLSTTDKVKYQPGIYHATYTGTLKDNPSEQVIFTVTWTLKYDVTSISFSPASQSATYGQGNVPFANIVLPSFSHQPTDAIPTPVWSWSISGQETFDGNAQPIIFDSPTSPTSLVFPVDAANIPQGSFLVTVTVQEVNGIKGTLDQTIQIIDPCTEAGGLTLSVSGRPNHLTWRHQASAYTHNMGAAFRSSNPAFCQITSYSCRWWGWGAWIDCNNSSAQGAIIFDTLTGDFTFLATDPTQRPVAGYNYEVGAVAGTAGDIRKSFTFNIYMKCALITNFRWNPQQEATETVYRRDYRPGIWRYSQPLDPLDPSKNPVHNQDPGCAAEWKVINQEINTSGEITEKVEVPMTSDQTSLQVTVQDLLVGWSRKFLFEAYFKNVAILGEAAGTLTRTYQFEDGYQLLKLDQYTQLSETINLQEGFTINTFTTPFFVDDEQFQVTTLPDPTAPQRTAYFKVVGDDRTPIADYLIITIQDNSEQATVDVRFQRTETSIRESFRLTICYSYSGYTALQELCDETVQHRVVNTLGTCIVSYDLQMNAEKVTTLEAAPIKYVLGDDGISLFRLSDFVTPVFGEPGKEGPSGETCGVLGFKQANRTQELLISVGLKDGLVNLNQTSDEKSVGTHKLNFEAYLVDLDPQATQVLSIPLKVTLIVERPPVILKSDFLGNLVRQPPSSLEPIAPRYYAMFNQTQSFKFEFADQLAIAKEAGEKSDLYKGLSSAGLRITIKTNELPGLVIQTGVSYQRGVGFGAITLLCDWVAAMDLLRDKLIVDPKSQPQIEGKVVIKVEDNSEGGHSSLFETQFMFSHQDSANSTTSASTFKQTAYEEIIQEAQNRQLINSANLKKEAARLKYASLDVGPPQVRIRNVSKDGEVVLSFSNDMIIPTLTENSSRLLAHATTGDAQIQGVLKMEEMLQTEIIRDSYSDLDFTNISETNEKGQYTDVFNWSIKGYTEDQMRLQLNFERPQEVSQAGEDRVRITFKNTTLIFDWLGNEVEIGTVIEQLLPPQYASETEAEVFGAMEEVFTTYETGSFHSDVVINAMIAGTLQSVWSEVSTQQIIILVPLFKITMPANAQAIFSVLLQVASFEMIPTDLIYEDMLSKLEDFREKEIIQQKIEQLGFETTWLLPNLGSLIFFMGLFPVMVAIVGLLTCLANFCQPCAKRRDKLHGFVFWNWPIVFLRDSYIVIQICCLYNLRYYSMHNEEAKTNTVLALSFLISLLLYPLGIQFYLYKRRSMLGNKQFTMRYNEAYEGLSTKGYDYLLYPLFFYYRRLLVPMSVIFYPESIMMQQLTMALTGIATIILIGFQQPFERKLRNKFEILQECTILLISYHVLCFTAWLPDLALKHSIGYSVVGVVALQLFLTLGAQAFVYIRTRINKWKRAKYISQQKQRSRAYLQSRKPKIKQCIARRKARAYETDSDSYDSSFSSSSCSSSLSSKSSDSSEEEKKVLPTRVTTTSKMTWAAPITRVAKHPKQIRYRQRAILKDSSDESRSSRRQDNHNDIKESSFHIDGPSLLDLDVSREHHIENNIIIENQFGSSKMDNKLAGYPVEEQKQAQRELKDIDSLFARGASPARPYPRSRGRFTMEVVDPIVAPPVAHQEPPPYLLINGPPIIGGLHFDYDQKEASLDASLFYQPHERYGTTKNSSQIYPSRQIDARKHSDLSKQIGADFQLRKRTKQKFAMATMAKSGASLHYQ